MRKRGLSPVIASVLLIMLVLVLASIVFLWARGFVSEQIEKFGASIDTQCENVDFDVDLVVVATGIYTLEAVNYGNIPIGYLEIKKVKGGNSEVEAFKTFRLSQDDSMSDSVDLDMENGNLPDSLVVYPVLLGNVVGDDSTKAYTCSDYGRTLHL